MTRRSVPLAAGAAIASLLLATAAPACGPDWPDPVFSFETRPGPDADAFLRGRLGVLPPRLAPAHRLILYRHLATDATAETTAAAFAGLLSSPPSGTWIDAPAARWRRAAARYGADPGWIHGVRREEREGKTGTWFVSYPNCLDDAFETALETLADRAAAWGESSPALRAWLDGQNAVFANCRGGESTPAELPPDWPPLLRQDRRYQIAAAHSYSHRWETARALFAAIATDTDSPWANVSRYLVGRCELRLERWEQAISTFAAVLDEPALAPWHDSARGLLRLARLRLDPAARGAEIVANLLAPEPRGDAPQDFADLLRQPWIVDRDTPFGRWFSVRNATEALALWRAEPTTATLALALAMVPPDESSTADLEAAAEALSEDSPLAVTAAAFRAGAALTRGNVDRVRSLLDPWLARDDLSPSDRNRLAALRAPAAAGLIEYVALSLARPVAQRTGGGSREVALRHDASALDLPAAPHRILEREVPLSGWLELAGAKALDPAVRSVFALSGHTRATAIDNAELALRFAERLANLDQATGAPLLAAAQIEDPAERRFASALALLETPGATVDLALYRPYLQHAEQADSAPRTFSTFRLNWWCAPQRAEVAVDAPAFLAAAGGVGPEERDRVLRIEAGPILLGRRVLEYADAQPDDPRVPRALHLVVQSTRSAPTCPETAYGEVSRGAFERLHRRYPQSDWTDRTPYWFDG